MRELLTGARERGAQLEEEIRLAMVEEDPNDEKNVIVEIQGGAGGEEAGLWAGDLYRMLTRYAERRSLQVEPLEAGEGKYTFAIKGQSRNGPAGAAAGGAGAGAYSVFKFEGGTHRVQRVPATESQGRIHTSTATVAVLPEVEEVEVRSTRTTCRSTSTARPARAASRSTRPTRRCASRTSRRASSWRCRTRSPSCKTARRRCGCCARACTSGRSPSSRPSSRPTAARRSGTGDRAEKIRTYNYGERRVTDHRIKLTTHNLDAVLEGELDEFTQALQSDEKRRGLEAQTAAPQ